jgi:hypothetical protein
MSLAVCDSSPLQLIELYLWRRLIRVAFTTEARIAVLMVTLTP